VHSALKQIDSDWHAGNFKAVGTEGAQLGHDMLGVTDEPNADKDTLKQTFDGAFEKNSLPDSTKLIPCIDDDTASKIVAFIPQALDKASSGSLSDLLALPALIK